MARSRRLPRLEAALLEEADYSTSSPQELARTAELSLARMERAVLIPRDRLQPMGYQPRQSLREDEALHDLARSIAVEGLLQPLVAAPNPEKPGYYLLIAGHRRLAAAGLLAREEVELALPDEEADVPTAAERQRAARAAAGARVAALPATLRDVDPDTAFALALVENLQRDDLTRREVMDAVKRLRDHYGWSIREIERRTGRSKTDLSRLLRIAEDSEVAELVASERITPTAASPLVERYHADVRGPILAAIRSGELATQTEIEAALERAHRPAIPAAPSPDSRVVASTDLVTEREAESTLPRKVSHMGQQTIGGTAEGAAGTAQPPDPTFPTPADAPEGRIVPVTSHTRRIGVRPRFDAERAERLAHEMIQFAREDVPPDAASQLMLAEALQELDAYLGRHRRRGR